MSEKKPFGVKETVRYEFDYNELVPGDVYIIKTKSMPEPRFAIYEAASEVYANFLIPDNTAVASDRYRTAISIDELVDGSAIIERVLSYSEYVKHRNRKCGDCKNYRKCKYPGCPMTVDTPACIDFKENRRVVMICGQCRYFASCSDQFITKDTTACSAFVDCDS